MSTSDPLVIARTLAESIEVAADRLTPDVIRAARATEDGRHNLNRIEYALNTIGKALVLTDYTIDQEQDLDRLTAFRKAQGKSI